MFSFSVATFARRTAAKLAPRCTVQAARLSSTSSNGAHDPSARGVLGVIAGLTAAAAVPLSLVFARKADDCGGVCSQCECDCRCSWRKKAAEWDHNWDFREPTKAGTSAAGDKDEKKNAAGAEEVDKPKMKGSRYIILLRHGHYMNHDSEDDKEQGLSPLGKKQISLAAERLKLFDKHKKISSITRSNMQRVLDSTEILKKALPSVTNITCDPLLREGYPIVPTPIRSSVRPADAFVDGPRIEHAFRKHFYRPCQEEDTYEIIVGHGNVIRYFVCRALQIPAEAWLRMSPMNASITILAIRPSGAVSLQCIGDTGHIAAPDVTFN